MDEKNKRTAKKSKKAFLKLKSKKLKERGSLNRSIEICRASESKGDLKIMKENKPIQTGKEKKKDKLDSKKKRKNGVDVDANNEDQLSRKDARKVNGKNSGGIAGNDNAKKYSQSKMFEISDLASAAEANTGTKIKSKKCKKDGKGKRKDLYIAKEVTMEESQSEVDAEKVDQILLVDEDCSRGMKKWLIQYKESRPGLKILQQRIDEFITSYEAEQEQERIEREARAAEGGWTVVVHHKGRKKTTDSESGIAVGSVAEAAVMDQMAKKRNNEVAVDFYRFQKREAQRNEVMMLQSKFEQDKKRIQQLRAARKFRPY